MRGLRVARVMTITPPTSITVVPPQPCSVVRAHMPGVCGTCGAPTQFACGQCGEAHFCSAVCLNNAFERHRTECGLVGFCPPVLLPEPPLMSNQVNVQLRTRLSFWLKQRQGCPSPSCMLASKEYGLESISVPQALASSMAAKVISSRCQKDYLKIGDKSFPGYISYSAIPVPVVAAEQSRRTSMLLAHEGHIRYCMEQWPEFKLLVEHVASSLGVGPERCKQVHFIRQNSKQCQFTWHQDHQDLKMSESMITVVILLKGSSTGMQVWGFRPFTYPGVGSGAAFAGAATHRSVYQVLGSPWSDIDVIKVGLFFD